MPSTRMRSGPGTTQSPRRKSEAQILLEAVLDELVSKYGYEWIAEYRFHFPRRWRFDYCIVDRGIAVEIEGAIWTRGRHTRGKGFEADIEKYNQAAIDGFKVLRFSTQQVLKGEAERMLRLVL
jgi:very-short-patch-repair endonuclease